MSTKNENWKLPSLESAKKSRNPISYQNYDLPEEFLGLGLGKKYYIRTYGCQANERDSESLAGILQQLGFQVTKKAEDSDLIVLNTCAVRKNAEDKVIGEIGALKKLKRENPNLLIAVCGCMAQEEEMVDLVLKKHRQVDLIFGTHNIDRLPWLLAACFNKQERIVEVFSDHSKVIEDLPVKRFKNHKAWINVAFGCDKFCTYCIVPYTRGRQRSRKAEEVLNEVKTCLDKGYKEVTLLGQNVNAYGKDFGYEGGFARLLSEVAKTGIARVRFVTSHPWDFSNELIETMKEYDNIMPYLHLPLQSGDDEILKKMGRRYTRAEYLSLFDRLKEAMPELAFSTDIIVGFPGESEEQFLNTLAVVDHCKFDNIFSFVYSPREKTPASYLVDDLDMAVKKERLKRLNDRFKPLALANAKKYLGQTLEVLVDGSSKNNPDVYSGYSPGNKVVNFSGDTSIQAGDLVKVKIERVKTFTLEGTVIE